MNEKYLLDTIDDKTLVKLIDETLILEKDAKNKNIKASLLKIIPAVAAVVLVISLANLISILDMGGWEYTTAPGAAAIINENLIVHEDDGYGEFVYGEYEDISYLLEDINWGGGVADLAGIAERFIAGERSMMYKYNYIPVSFSTEATKLHESEALYIMYKKGEAYIPELKCRLFMDVYKCDDDNCGDVLVKPLAVEQNYESRRAARREADYGGLYIQYGPMYPGVDEGIRCVFRDGNIITSLNITVENGPEWIRFHGSTVIEFTNGIIIEAPEYTRAADGKDGAYTITIGGGSVVTTPDGIKIMFTKGMVLDNKGNIVFTADDETSGQTDSKAAEAIDENIWGVIGTESDSDATGYYEIPLNDAPEHLEQNIDGTETFEKQTEQETKEIENGIKNITEENLGEELVLENSEDNMSITDNSSETYEAEDYEDISNLFPNSIDRVYKWADRVKAFLLDYKPDSGLSELFTYDGRHKTMEMLEQGFFGKVFAKGTIYVPELNCTLLVAVTCRGIPDDVAGSDIYYNGKLGDNVKCEYPNHADDCYEVSNPYILEIFGDIDAILEILNTR